MNIRKYLKETLENKKLLNLLPDKKVYFLHAYKPQTPYVEYQIITEVGEEFSEGRERYTKYIIQIDIFSKSDFTNIEEAIKEILIENGFYREMSIDLWENDTKLYHKVLRFNISIETK